MKNFQLITSLDIGDLRADIRKYADLFRSTQPDIKKEDIGYTHKDAQLILCRYPPMPKGIEKNDKEIKKLQDTLFSEWLPPWIAFKPALAPLIYDLMRKVNGTHIGGIGIVKLSAGKSISMHYDKGLSTKFYARFHITVEGPEKCFFICGEGDDEERVAMAGGDVWWFDCKKLHGVENSSDRDRISVSVDIGVM